MKYQNKKPENLRNKLQIAIGSLFAKSLAKHLGTCHKCRKRMGIAAEVEVGFSLLRSQIKSTQLLAMANQKAVSVLKHQLRQNPRTISLSSPKPKMPLTYHLARAATAIKAAAACILICVFLKIGVFSSLQDSQETGRIVLRNYYARSVGDKMANQIFDL